MSRSIYAKALTRPLSGLLMLGVAMAFVGAPVGIQADLSLTDKSAEAGNGNGKGKGWKGGKKWKKNGNKGNGWVPPGHRKADGSQGWVPPGHRKKGGDWTPPGLAKKQNLGDFANHGDKVKTMTELAKLLGHDPSVGAMQANFGNMYDALEEAGREDLIEDLSDAKEMLKRAEELGDKEAIDLATEEVDSLMEEVNEVVEDVDLKPGEGPVNGWETVDMDVTGDGKVDAADLEAARLLTQ